MRRSSRSVDMDMDWTVLFVIISRTRKLKGAAPVPRNQRSPRPRPPPIYGFVVVLTPPTFWTVVVATKMRPIDSPCSVILASGPFVDNATLTPPPCAEPMISRIAAGELPLALLMPVHPPKYPLLELFGASVAACGPAILFSPVFTATPDFEEAVARIPSLFRSHKQPWATLSLIGNQRLPKNVNLPSFKKFIGLRFLFSRTSLAFAMAVDAELLVVGQISAGIVAALESWRTRRMIISTRTVDEGKFIDVWYNATNKRHPPLANTVSSCRAIQLQHAEKRAASKRWGSRQRGDIPAHLGSFNLWWNDAPLYSRDDWAGFEERLSPKAFAAATAASVLEANLFDHSAFLCYLLLVRNWTGNADPLLEPSDDEPARPPPLRA